MGAEELIIALLFAGIVGAFTGKGDAFAGRVEGVIEGKPDLADFISGPLASFSPQEIKAARQKKNAEYSLYFMLGSLSVSKYTTKSYKAK